MLKSHKFVLIKETHTLSTLKFSLKRKQLRLRRKLGDFNDLLIMLTELLITRDCFVLMPKV